MSRDHYIPQFILRGFSVNPKEAKNKQEIYVYSKKTNEVKRQLIADSFMQVDYNSPETEKYLAQELETKVANIVQKIKAEVNKENKIVDLEKNKYVLLIRFLVVMWRRNLIQVDRMKEIIDASEYISSIFSAFGTEEINIGKLYEENKDIFRKTFFDLAIRRTTKDDETVQKTIKYYKPFIVHNTSNINFIMHNTYSTLNYLSNKNDEVTEQDFPIFMIYPISKKLCLCMLLNIEGSNLAQNNYTISIETWSDEADIKRFLINGYITPTAESFVVDETNIEYLQNLLNN